MNSCIGFLANVHNICQGCWDWFVYDRDQRDLGSYWDLATFQRSRVWATSFSTVWRRWHINLFSNIICHKWESILLPGSQLKAPLAMPIRTLFSHITRPTCQIARLIHTVWMHQNNWEFCLETYYLQDG